MKPWCEKDTNDDENYIELQEKFAFHLKKRESQIIIILSKHFVEKTIRRETKNFVLKNRYFGILLSKGGHGWGILEYTWLEIHVNLCV